ncbi:putative transcriptional regulator with HTH domain [Terriglobus roseus DSM 18391]|uniref:Putative transcriptional regulator with HTH domain n=1 Tax=Terriglobus roseus (strain DSM 18391 / NRRL B-41598 / KBS 63) TaxID=926566 RepID=I3ZMM4_TERRK|nr:ATP-binding protein [Terriglobus roseus]AFL90492.1 putative transcriptional regulator with HTH domain [Terriglobus roseus DSM 18391]
MPLHKSESAFTLDTLQRIFSFESEASDRLISRENTHLEFKESFNMGSADDYAKTAAAFANTQGGYLVFGVKDQPRQVIGLKSSHFDSLDAGKLTLALNERFSPEIDWEMLVWEARGRKVGLLYFAQAGEKPVVCTRSGGSIQQGAIYYRYRGRSEAIRYPELRKMLNDEKQKERDLWLRQLRKMSSVGIGKVGILDLVSGEVSGAQGKFFISEELLPRLQFLQAGRFVEQDGAPALRLLGDLHASEGPVLHSTIKVPTSIREPEILEAFLRREPVLSPPDYIRAICSESSPYQPLYFFIQQTSESISDTVAAIQAFQVRGHTRNKIIARLNSAHEVVRIGTMTGSGQPAAKRRELLMKLHNKTLTTTDMEEEKIRFLEALTHAEFNEVNVDYVFELLLAHVLPTVASMSGNMMTTFRKALCHLDIETFKGKVI